MANSDETLAKDGQSGVPSGQSVETAKPGDSQPDSKARPASLQEMDFFTNPDVAEGDRTTIEQALRDLDPDAKKPEDMH